MLLWRKLFARLMIGGVVLSSVACLSRRLENTSAPFTTTEVNSSRKSRREACELNGNAWKNEQCMATVVVLTPAEQCRREPAKTWDSERGRCVNAATITLKEACASKDAAVCRQIQEEACRGLGKELGGDGQCKEVVALHEFIYYCEQGEKANSEVQRTVAAMLASVESKSCPQAAAALKGQEMLNLQGRNIVTLAPLYGMRQLRSVVLANNRIEDLRPLASLSQLRYLDLYQNAINDVGPLADLTELEFLYLNQNPLGSVAPLANLGKLRELRLEGILLGARGSNGISKNKQNCPPSAASDVLRIFCARP